MSMTNELPAALQWDLQDRLAKSLRVSGLSVQEMADYLDVHRNTVGGWINGRQRMSTQSMRLWAEYTGVPFEWLRDGTGPSHPHPPAQPFRPPHQAERVRQLRPVADVVGDRQPELVNAKDRWSWYAEAIAENSTSKPVGKTTRRSVPAVLSLLDTLPAAA